MCRGSSGARPQCGHRPRQQRRAARFVLRLAAAAAQQPMKSLLPLPLATTARVNLNLVWDAMEPLMAADRPDQNAIAVAGNLRNHWLEEQMEAESETASTPHQQPPGAPW